MRIAYLFIADCTLHVEIWLCCGDMMQGLPIYYTEHYSPLLACLRSWRGAVWYVGGRVHEVPVGVGAAGDGSDRPDPTGHGCARGHRNGQAPVSTLSVSS